MGSEVFIACSVLAVDSRGRVFLQLRDSARDIENAGRITLFGGLLKDGETPAQGAVRELKEELGVVVPVEAVEHLLIAEKSDWRGRKTLVHVLRWLGASADVADLKEGVALVLGEVEKLLECPLISDVTRSSLRLHASQSTNEVRARAGGC